VAHSSPRAVFHRAEAQLLSVWTPGPYRQTRCPHHCYSAGSVRNDPLAKNSSLAKGGGAPLRRRAGVCVPGWQLGKAARGFRPGATLSLPVLSRLRGTHPQRRIRLPIWRTPVCGCVIARRSLGKRACPREVGPQKCAECIRRHPPASALWNTAPSRSSLTALNCLF